MLLYVLMDECLISVRTVRKNLFENLGLCVHASEFFLES